MASGNPNWPEFLDWLDSDPQPAMSALYARIGRFLEVCPPREVRSLSGEDRADLKQTVLLQLVEDDFRVLRGYKDIGRPFDGWLYFVIRSRAYDMIRGKTPTLGDATGDNAKGQSPAISDHSKRDLLASDELESAEVIDLVNRCIAEFDSYGQLLLKLGAEEYTPQEMVVVLRRLGFSDLDNVKVSNDLRYRRRKLTQMLEEHGVQIGKYAGRGAREIDH